MSQVLEAVETVEAFRQRARTWIDANLGPIQPEDLTQNCESDEAELVAVARDRKLQRKLYDGGFAGICFPTEYGGQGLTPAHQHAFNEELAGHEFPSRFMVPTFTPCAAVLLEFGSPEQKARHLPGILKGDEVWVQMLSEPGGGSDVAGASTGAVRDGDEWVLNGSKVWTSRAWWADWGLCLARTNWNVPKHSGLSVFIVPLNAPGLEIRRIERLNGETEACEEFFTNVRIPDSDRVGQVDAGWSIGTRWMYHERMGGNSPYVTKPIGLKNASSEGRSIVDIAAAAGKLDDPNVRELIGESRTLDIVMHTLQRRLANAASSGKANTDSSAINRLAHGVAAVRKATIAFELAGNAAAAWTEEEDDGSGAPGMQFLMRQTACIGGGTTEIARNVIAERILGMPREASGDRDVAYRDIPRGPKRA